MISEGVGGRERRRSESNGVPEERLDPGNGTESLKEGGISVFEGTEMGREEEEIIGSDEWRELDLESRVGVGLGGSGSFQVGRGVEDAVTGRSKGGREEVREGELNPFRPPSDAL